MQASKQSAQEHTMQPLLNPSLMRATRLSKRCTPRRRERRSRPDSSSNPWSWMLTTLTIPRTRACSLRLIAVEKSIREELMSDVRLLVTNDIFGSFFRQETTWGVIAGGDAIVKTVNRLREGSPTSAWVDGGDFSGGGPL